MTRPASSSGGLRRARAPIVQIDRAALIANWRMLARRAASARTGAAVKADGYGLGAKDVGRALSEAGCRDFFVAWAEEGEALRDALRGVSREPEQEARIFVLQGLEPAVVPVYLGRRLTPVLSSLEQIAIWREGLRQTGVTASAALQLETGMNRLGLDAEDARVASELYRTGALSLCLVMSHLASADEQTAQSSQQLDRFEALSRMFPSAPRSLANSAGVFLGKDFAFDLTRPGIALYGGAGASADGSIRPVATLQASVLQVRTARAGEAAGYGAAARLARDTRIATIGLGYADGYPRAASGAGVYIRQIMPPPEVFVAGRRAPVLGRVSMDLTLVDVSDLPESAVAPGDAIEVFGPNIPIDEVAARSGTIAYELLTSLGARVTRLWT